MRLSLKWSGGGIYPATPFNPTLLTCLRIMQEPLPPQFYVELQLAPIEKGEIRLTKRQYVNESCVAEG